MYTKIKYEHPWPLFFRCFCELKNDKLSKEDTISIMVEIIKFSVTFLTVSGKDSKDAISMFSTIFDGIYRNNGVNKDWVLYQIHSKTLSAGLRKAEVLSALKTADVFDKNKQLGAAVLATYESKYKSGDSLQVSWDEAYSKFSTYGEAYTLDHIMVQTPSINDVNLKYYKLGNSLKLKEGHDFPEALVYDGMEYSNFKSLILHRAGNLRLKGGDGNASHGNTSEACFSTNKQLEQRNDEVCDFFVNKVICAEDLNKNFSPDAFIVTPKNKMTGNFVFSMPDLDFTGTKPASITINGQTIGINSHKDILTCISKYVFEVNKNKFVEVAKTEWKPRRRVIITQKKSKLANPFELIENEVYVETNLSARDIMFYSTKLLEEFDIQKDIVSVYIPE